MFDVDVAKGSDEYAGEMISRTPGFKMPPIQCCEEQRSGQQLIIRHYQDPIPFLSRVIKEHQLIFHLMGRVIADPAVSTWRLLKAMVSIGQPFPNSC
jgi:hypothetical protein